MILKDYFEKTLHIISKSSNFKSDFLHLAGRKIHLTSNSSKLRHLFLPSISHLITEKGDGREELTIWYVDNECLEVKVKAPEWKNIEFNAQGFATDFDQDEYQIFFQPWIRQLFLYSRKDKTGIYWVNSVEEVPWWEPTFSFRVIFHLWTRDLPAQLIHAGAIANNDNDAWLITGPSGSGKSTTCMNLLRSGYKYLGDDYIWVEIENTPKVYALYQTAKLESDNYHERFYDWKQHLINSETYLKRKAIFNIQEIAPESWLQKANLKGILLPKVTNNRNGVILPVNATNALLAMAPTTLHHLPHHRQEAYEKLKIISSLLPSYQWLLGTNEFECELNFKHFIKNDCAIN